MANDSKPTKQETKPKPTSLDEMADAEVKVAQLALKGGKK